VDHVWEGQVFRHAWVQAFSQFRGEIDSPALSAMMRHRVQEWSTVVNGVPNLNVTSSSINRSKQGPFRRFVNRVKSRQREGGYGLRQFTLDDAFGASLARHTIEDDEWAAIKKTVVKTFDAEIEPTAQKLAAVKGRKDISESFVEHLQTLLSQMDIE
jgi:hypothetical protein